MSSTTTGDRLTALRAAVDALYAAELQALSDGDLDAHLAAVHREISRQQNWLARAADAAKGRAAQRVRDAGGDPAKAEAAARQREQDLADELRVSKREATQLTRSGKDLRQAPPTLAAAAASGDVSARHAAVIRTATRDIEDLNVARALRAELAEKAPLMDPAALRRYATRRLAEIDQRAALEAERRKHSARSARATMTEDGMLGLTASLAGLDAETVMAGLDVFRIPDAVGEMRRPEQRTADALVAMAAFALEHAETTDRGTPTQVVVTVDRETIQTGRGVVETRWVGPLPACAVVPLLDDAQLAAVIRDGGAPTVVTNPTRNVPNALYRLLLARDGGCITEGCDAPAGWCDVAHLHIPFEKSGALSESNAGLLCRRHHRDLDLTDAWAVTWDRPPEPDEPDQPGLARPRLVRSDRVPPGATTSPPHHLDRPRRMLGGPSSALSEVGHARNGHHGAYRN